MVHKQKESVRKSYMVLVALPSVKQGLVMVDETSNKADAIKKAKKYKYGFVNKADTETVFSTT